MGLTYGGINYRSLEEQVRYDAEQVQILKQADVAINENLQTINGNLQTVNTEINGKLTKPTNPSAESAVTMLTDGTVGTKPLSEIGGGGGKLYIHRVTFKFDGNAFFGLTIDIPSNTNNAITVDYLRNYLRTSTLGECVVSFSGADGTGAVSLRCNNRVTISGVVCNSNSTNVVNVSYDNTNGLFIEEQLLIEL